MYSINSLFWTNKKFQKDDQIQDQFLLHYNLSQVVGSTRICLKGNRISGSFSLSSLEYIWSSQPLPHVVKWLLAFSEKKLLLGILLKPTVLTPLSLTQRHRQSVWHLPVGNICVKEGNQDLKCTEPEIYMGTILPIIVFIKL